MLEHVRVRALPDHLPQSIHYSIASLATFDDAIHVRDLEIPADATLLTDLDEVVAKVLAPRVEEEPTPVAEGEAAEGAEGEAAEGAEGRCSVRPRASSEELARAERLVAGLLSAATAADRPDVHGRQAHRQLVRRQLRRRAPRSRTSRVPLAALELLEQRSPRRTR